MLDLLPEDLVKAIKGEIHEPTTSGRKTAIDEDNINDVAHFMRNPKGRKEPLDDFIKGTKSKPFKYAVDNRKWKSITYLCGARQPQFYLNVFSNKITDAPKWYKYFYVMVYNAKYKITHIPPEFYWPLIYDCPVPIACIRMLLRDYQVTYKTGFINKRVNNSREKDEEVFKGLTDDKQKIELVKYIKQNQLNMEFDEVVLDDGNLTCISMLFGYYNLCYYCVRYSKKEEFKSFVDENRSTFDYLGECHIIMPQFKELYEYAYAKAKKIPKNYDDLDKKSILHEHAELLAKNKCYNELKFMLRYGYTMTFDCGIEK
ncbi:hypothetical protein M9Y10_042993 [Tritrichomonas musculus]|uniref:Uncharacterized protein n=1 Tax=Tritrichomonas musculus TaxID=1915356 RepID=A0ABR2K091_9EUKA